MASTDHDRRTDLDATQDAALLEKAIFEVKRVIVGQDQLVERVMVGLLAKGHILLEGVPGVAKTLAVETFAKVVGGSFSRVQFTPDLVPTDLIGTRIFRQGKEQFDIELGPVVANFLLADEINRAPAKVQSALLEVMAERQVSIGGRTFPMPDPFLVMATQNPIENEGVYPLPEAQRDRFLFKIVVDYPTIEEEREIVYRMGVEPPTAKQILDPDQLIRLQAAASSIFVHHALVDYVVRVIFATRAPEQFGMHDVAAWIAYGASPRATLGVISAARALALLRGRDYVIPQDVIEVIPDVLRHRLVLSYDALADEVTPESIIGRVLRTVGLPQVAPQPVGGAAPQQFPGPVQQQPGQPNPSQIPPVGYPSAPTQGPSGQVAPTAANGAANPSPALNTQQPGPPPHQPGPRPQQPAPHPNQQYPVQNHHYPTQQPPVTLPGWQNAPAQSSQVLHPAPSAGHGRAPQSGSVQQPGSAQQSGSAQQPAATQQSGSTQQPAVAQKAGPVQQTGSAPQPGQAQQPSRTPQPGQTPHPQSAKPTGEPQSSGAARSGVQAPAEKPAESNSAAGASTGTENSGADPAGSAPATGSKSDTTTGTSGSSGQSGSSTERTPAGPAGWTSPASKR